MAYPPGFLFPPPLPSCPSVVLGPRAGHEGSAFAPYSAAGPHAPYGAEPRAAAAISSFLSPAFEPSAAGLDFHPFASLGPCHPYADPAYRKNATRDATATLKAWLSEHRKNPYPTKGEKIMLAIITKMTLTQVSTWFANARRRLKKENKMTWTPRNRSEDEDEDLDPENLDPENLDPENLDPENLDPENLDPENLDPENLDPERPERRQKDTASVSAPPWFTSDPASSDCTPHCSPAPRHAPQRPLLLSAAAAAPPSPPAPAPPSAQDSPKPKLWSLAEIATSSDRKPSGHRTPGAHGGGGGTLSAPLYVSPAYIYHHYALPSLNGLYARPDRDFGLRTSFAAEKQDHQLLVPP